MTTINPGIGRLLAAAGGVLLLVALFLPWAETVEGASLSGFDVSETAAVLYTVSAALGIAAAVTGGRFGFFRPDVSLNGAADLFGVISAVLIGWLILFDFPAGAGHDLGVYLALAGAAAIACGAGDFRVKSVFPKLSAPAGDSAGS